MTRYASKPSFDKHRRVKRKKAREAKHEAAESEPTLTAAQKAKQRAEWRPKE
ncbi:MAG TPA: hypothetical protein VEW42_03820 [Candidatus Eisenbacteria bacterium]|nr:hypothetical protein [Candidatus Eisenbacteria bacterium]